MLKLLIDTVRQSGGAALLDFVSPSFFEVVSVGKSTLLASRLIRDAMLPIPADQGALFQRMMDAQKIPVLLDVTKARGNAKSTALGGLTLSDEEYGSVILKLYFSLIFMSQESILDLRCQTFSMEDGRLIWRPARVVHQWEVGFIEPMREIYRGFYSENKKQFRDGLDKLHLGSAEDLFLAHFGTGDQSQVTFTMSGFRKSFHDIFVHCKAHKIRLHEDFLPLGILLGSLYENLSHLTVALNVREAFMSVTAG